ncbi:MAG: tetratricopeptide repeat protein [Patescibacteria group bacterium]
MTEDNLTEKIMAYSFWDDIGRWSVYLLGFLVPILALPYTSSPLTTNKVALSYFLIIFAFFCWLIGRINTGTVILPKNYLALALALMVAVWFVSGIFSLSPHLAFFELSEDASSFFAMLMFVLAAFVAYFYLRTPEKAFLWFLAMFMSAALIFIFQFLHIFFGLNVLPWVELPSKTSNLFGSWTEFGAFFSIVGVLSIFLFEVLVEKKLRALFLGLSLASFFALAAVNNRLLWWVVFAFLLIIMAYLLSLKPRRVNIFRATFFVLIAVLLFIQAPAISSYAVTYLGVDSLEVRPSWPASWTVIQKTLEGNALLGSGPATFVYDWLRFKPLAVNESIFWATRFSSGIAFATSLLASVGVIGFAVFLFTVLSFLYYGVKTLTASGQTRFDPLFILVILGALMVLTYSFVYSAGFVLTLFLFLFLGMFMAFISEYKIAGEYNITLFQSSGAGFISALAIIFLLIVAFSGFYVFGQKYAAAYFFGRAGELNSSGDTAGARSALDRAIVFDGRDIYFRAAAEFDLAQIAFLLQRGDLSPDDIRGGFQNLLSQSIQNAQVAVRINPAESLNWMSLGRIYEAVVPFKVTGASDFASAAYIEAAAKNPTSPEPLLAQARVALALSQLGPAKNLLEESLKLKNSYTPAHFLLAQIEEAQGNTQNAISRAEAAVILSPDDLGALFQLGLLYYRSNRLNDAGLVFERAVTLSPNYSNARYFLGLIYSRLGNKSAAIEQFVRIQGLNPQNEEVAKILNNLRAGYSALAGISPPPESRKEPPVKE